MEDPYLPEDEPAPDESTPWGFRILLILAALYLLWRFIEVIGWAWRALVG